MAFLFKLISRYKSINYKNPKKTDLLEKLKYFASYNLSANPIPDSSSSGLPDRISPACD
jgi:hypothetical protein